MSPEILYENDSMKTLTKWESKLFTSINEGRIDEFALDEIGLEELCIDPIIYNF